MTYGSLGAERLITASGFVSQAIRDVRELLYLTNDDKEQKRINVILKSAISTKDKLDKEWMKWNKKH